MRQIDLVRISDAIIVLSQSLDNSTHEDIVNGFLWLCIINEQQANEIKEFILQEYNLE